MTRASFSGSNKAAAAEAAAEAAAKTVLITGVSRGLGRSLVFELSKRGHTVIGCSRSQDKLNSLQSELSSPDRHLLLNVDVLKGTFHAKLNVPQLLPLSVFTDIKVLAVNNAGTINKNNRIWEVPVEEFDAVIDTNVKGIANVLRHFIPLMIPKSRGIIVNMSSGWGRSVSALVAPYCASKWAVEGLSRAVAKEMPDGFAVVAVSPGVINTEMLQSFFGNSAPIFQTPEAWSLKAATMILNLTAADNGASLPI